MPDPKSEKETERGEFVTETSSETMKDIEANLRSASMIYLIPAILLLAIGLFLWFWMGVAWWLYLAFFIGAGFLFFIGIMVLTLFVSVPKLEVYEGGLLVKPPKGSSVFHPWKDFRGYTRNEVYNMKVVELHLREGGEGAITIHEKVDRFDDVLELVDDNLEKLA